MIKSALLGASGDKERSFGRKWRQRFDTQYTIHNTQYAIHNTQYPIRNTQYAIRNTQYAIRNTQYAIRNPYPILTLGTSAQKKKYLPSLISGEMIGAHGMSEPDSGSDAYSLRTRAEKCDGGYRLNGTKTFVTSAPVADLAVIFATTNPKRKMWGITAFLVEKGTPGFTVSHDMEKMGMRTAPMGELILQDCYIPEKNRLGAEGAGGRIFNSSMEWERSCILGTHLGAMEHQLEVCIRYANQRHQFNQPISKFQSVSNRIADMKVRLETARLLLYKVAWLKKQGKAATMECEACFASGERVIISAIC